MDTTTRPGCPNRPVPMPDEQAVMTVPEAGAYVNLGRAAAYEAANRGDIPTLRIGRRLVVPTAAFRSMLGLPVERAS